jgi:hypothetical protein
VQSRILGSTLEKAHIWDGLSDRQCDMLKRVIMANENIFALKDITYERPQLGEKLHLQANIPHQIPKILKRIFFPLSHKGKEDMKKHMDDILEEEIIQYSTAAFSVPAFPVYQADPNIQVSQSRELCKAFVR